MQIPGEDGGQRLGVLARSPQPFADGFIRVARDFFGGPQTSSAHHNQERVGYF
jgi:hypothetical protein